MTRTLFVLASLITIAPLGLSAQATNAAGAQAAFHASYANTVTSLSMTEVTYAGAGVATQLGHGTDSGDVVATGPGSCAGGFANDNTHMLTAANGDTLTIVSHDVACPVGGGVYQGTGSWVVTGGTGRFSGATGQGEFAGRGQLILGGQMSFQLTGTIDAPNAD